MKSKLTKSESVAINKFAVTFAQVRAIRSELTKLQKVLAEQGEQVKTILAAKGNWLPTTSDKHCHLVEISTGRSHVSWSQSLVERFPVSDNNLKALIKSDFPDCFKVGVSNTVKATTLKEKRA